MDDPVADLVAQILIKRRTAPPWHWSCMADFYPGPKGAHNDLALTFYRLLDPTLKAEWHFHDISLLFRQLWLHARPLYPRRRALYAATTHLPHHDQPTCFLHHDGERLYVRPLRELAVDDTCSINWLPLRASMENAKAELSKWNLDPSAAPDIPRRGGLFDPLGTTETQEALELRCKQQVKALQERWPLGSEHVGDVAAWAAEVFHCPVWAQKALEERIMYYGQGSLMAVQARKRIKVLIKQAGYAAHIADETNPCSPITTTEDKLQQLADSIDNVNVNDTVSLDANPAELTAMMARLQQEKNKLIQMAEAVRAANETVNNVAAEAHDID
eukprot:GEMP01052309.1.p1 GENE.GEMP01052309.1~~GEMP01052309.1.p1  ORF type:complete len:330 (+),score=75.36 GEMP01052309.1:490-1479(+)